MEIRNKNIFYLDAKSKKPAVIPAQAGMTMGVIGPFDLV
jgi:hypothetical protein